MRSYVGIVDIVVVAVFVVDVIIDVAFWEGVGSCRVVVDVVVGEGVGGCGIVVDVVVGEGVGSCWVNCCGRR